MAREYSLEETWKLFEKLSPDLKEAIFSEDTAESIWNICVKNGVEDERISQIAKFTGRVLLGLLPPNEFQEALEKELKIETKTAKEITREITRYVFFPVKASLEELYKIEVTPVSARPAPTPPSVRPTPTEKPEIKPTEKPKEEKPVTDIYREPIE